MSRAATLTIVHRNAIWGSSTEKEPRHIRAVDGPSTVRREKEPNMAYEFVRRYLENCRVYLRAHRELSTCSDRELHDLGIDRADIEHIALQAAQG